MSWSHLIENWAQMMHELRASFPHLDLNALQRFRGSRIHLAQYLADTHDLTVSEAREALEDWLLYRGSRFVGTLAA